MLHEFLHLVLHLMQWPLSQFLSRNLQPTLPQPITSQQSTLPRSALRNHSHRPCPCRFLCVIFSIYLSIVVLFLLVTWTTVAYDAVSTTDPAFWTTPGLRLLGAGFQIDPDTQTLSVLWRVITCDKPRIPLGRVPTNTNLSDGCMPLDEPFDVYINDPSKPVLSYSPQKPIGDTFDPRDQGAFKMDHQVYKHGQWNPIKQPLVPFEYYAFRASAFAIHPLTNRSLHIPMFTITGTFGDFVIRSSDAASTSKFVFDPENDAVATDVPSRQLQVIVERSTIAKVFSTSLSLLSWSLAASSVYTTSLVTFGKMETSNILVPLPLCAATTILTIRASASSPLFGASVDTVASFVQFLMVSLSCLVLLIVLTKDRSLL